MQGWIGVRGKGTLDFLTNELSDTIDKTTGTFTRASLLRLNGKVVDQVGKTVQSPTRVPLDFPRHGDSRLLSTIDLIHSFCQWIKRNLQSMKLIITFMSTKLQHVQEALKRFVTPIVDDEWSLPSDDANKCVLYNLILRLYHVPYFHLCRCGIFIGCYEL